MGPRPAEGVRRAPGAEARVLTRQAQAPETLCFQGKLRNLRETLSLFQEADHSSHTQNKLGPRGAGHAGV